MGLGRIEPFDGSKDGNWQEYVERLEHFFVANGMDDAEKKRAVFLSVMGAATYKTLRNLVSPDKPGDKDVWGTSGETLSTFSTGPKRDSRTFQVPHQSWKTGRVHRHVRSRAAINV